MHKASGGQQYGMQTTHGTRRSCTCPVGCPEYVSSISRAVRCCTLLLLARARVGKHGHSGPRPVRQCRTSTIRMRVAPGHAESVWAMSSSVMDRTAGKTDFCSSRSGSVWSAATERPVCRRHLRDDTRIRLRFVALADVPSSLRDATAACVRVSLAVNTDCVLRQWRALQCANSGRPRLTAHLDRQA